MAGSLSVSERVSNPLRATQAEKTAFSILGAISVCHLLNDMVQSLIPAIYPILKASFHLGFTQIGIITLAFQVTASLLQPVVGLYTDRHPQPYSLVAGMGITLIGLLSLSVAPSFGLLLLSACCLGVGSSIFHPESARIARAASGGQLGLAQSLFQVGGNAGNAIGPLLGAFIVLPYGQRSIGWFSVFAVTGMIIVHRVGQWYSPRIQALKIVKSRHQETVLGPPSSRKVTKSISVLVALIFSKYFYLASITSYYTFYLIQKFGTSVQQSQLYLFLFLGAAAVGTLVGGPVGDRIGRKPVIWVSILGVLPFTLLLPYVNLFWTAVLSVLIGLIIASAFTAILVYAQELVPGKIGLISGVFFGLAFGMGGIGAAVLGRLADATSISFVYRVCSFLPLIGLLTAFLPPLGQPRAKPVRA